MNDNRQVVVVGAGAAGAAAAVAASQSSNSVILIDEQSAAGGWLHSSLEMLDSPPDFPPAMRGFEAAQDGTDQIAESSVDYRPNSIAWGLFENRTLAIAGPDGAYQLQPDRIVLATGSTEIVWPFAGWTLPGVMTARAARAFMHLHRVRPGDNVVVIGAGTDADQMVDDLEMAGANVVGRCRSPDGVVLGGDNQVEWAEIDGERHEADGVVLALGSLPDPELARHAMVDLVYSDPDGCHVPLRDRHMGTTADGIFVVGDAGGMTSFAEAVAQGMVAGYAATADPEIDSALAALEDTSQARDAAEPVGDVRRIPENEQVDREEQVTAERIREAILSGAVTLNDVKRRTRAGMGAAQGRDTEHVIARMINAYAEVPLDQLVPMTARPPARLVPLASLAKIAVAVE